MKRHNGVATVVRAMEADAAQDRRDSQAELQAFEAWRTVVGEPLRLPPAHRCWCLECRAFVVHAPVGA